MICNILNVMHSKSTMIFDDQNMIFFLKILLLCTPFIWVKRRLLCSKQGPSPHLLTSPFWGSPLPPPQGRCLLWIVPKKNKSLREAHLSTCMNSRDPELWPFRLSVHTNLKTIYTIHLLTIVCLDLRVCPSIIVPHPLLLINHERDARK